MQHITGIPRNQMCFSSLEDTISTDNPIRFIDAFVEILELNSLGFSVQTIKSKVVLVLIPKYFLKSIYMVI